MVLLLSHLQDNTDGAASKGFYMPRLGRFETGRYRDDSDNSSVEAGFKPALFSHYEWWATRRVECASHACAFQSGSMAAALQSKYVEAPSMGGESTSHPWAPAFAGVTEKGAGVTLSLSCPRRRAPTNERVGHRWPSGGERETHRLGAAPEFQHTCGDEASGFLRADAVPRLDRVADRRLLNMGGRFLPR